MKRRVPALVGQCRGDLALFMRQLARVGVVVSFQQKRIAVTMRSAPAMVILGDLICPLNAWSSYPPHANANQDARILEVAVAVAKAHGAGLVIGLHEQMLLRGVTSRCMQGKGHRKLLTLVASSEFRRALADARKNDTHGVVCAGKSPTAILIDNRTRDAPAELAPYWDRMSVFDRGTRFQARSGASYADLPVLGLGSSALAVHPLALRDHLTAEYGRLRSMPQQWRATVEAIGEHYAAYDRARRRCLVVLGGSVVPDPEQGALAVPVGELQAPLTRMFEDIVTRYHLRGVSAAELYAVTVRALGLAGQAGQAGQAVQAGHAAQ